MPTWEQCLHSEYSVVGYGTAVLQLLLPSPLGVSSSARCTSEYFKGKPPPRAERLSRTTRFHRVAACPVRLVRGEGLLCLGGPPSQPQRRALHGVLISDNAATSLRYGSCLISSFINSNSVRGWGRCAYRRSVVVSSHWPSLIGSTS